VGSGRWPSGSAEEAQRLAERCASCNQNQRLAAACALAIHSLADRPRCRVFGPATRPSPNA
jgi:hypothetical protein